ASCAEDHRARFAERSRDAAACASRRARDDSHLPTECTHGVNINEFVGTLFANGSAMTHVTHVTRVLRWTFRGENDEAVVCELGLTGYDREYELRVPAK